MELIHTQTLTKPQKTAALKLWNGEYPEQLKCETPAAFDQYLSTLTNVHHCLLTIKSGTIAGWAFKFIRNDEWWFVIILDGSVHLKGFGSLLLTQLKEKETVLNGWVVDHNEYLKSNGQSYRSPVDFYLKNGFKIITDIRLELPHLSGVKITWKKED